MASPQVLPLYNKIYFLIKLLYKTARNIPKEYKYSIGNETILLSWKCLDLFCEANESPDSEKYRAIKLICAEFDKLKARLRMMQEINLISAGQFSHLQVNYIIPIGVQLGGWLKWAAEAGAAGDKDDDKAGDKEELKQQTSNPKQQIIPEFQ